MCGLLGSSKRLPTAAEPALRPMGAVPRGAEDTCLPPELFVAHHAAPGPAAGLAACSLRRPLPRAALPRGRGGDSVPRGSSAASPRPAARPPTRLDVPRGLLCAYLSSEKKKAEGEKQLLWQVACPVPSSAAQLQPRLLGQRSAVPRAVLAAGRLFAGAKASLLQQGRGVHGMCLHAQPLSV